MSNKETKKWEKKQKRSSHMLFRETGIKTCETSRFLMLCNVGLVSGLQREEVINLFLPFGNLENVCMIPGKSYCFVAFYNVEDSERAYSALHGKAKLSVPNTVLYLVFTENVPTCGFHEAASCWPSGLILLEDFINEEEEEILLKCVRWDSGSENCGKSLKHRRVKHYGYEFRYDNNNVDKDDPLPVDLPEECSFFAERLFKRSGIMFKPDQLTVNEYQPGQGIPPHIDTHSAFEDVIASLSLGSSVVMEFKHSDGQHACICLPRRSVVIMTGESSLPPAVFTFTFDAMDPPQHPAGNPFISWSEVMDPIHCIVMEFTCIYMEKVKTNSEISLIPMNWARRVHGGSEGTGAYVRVMGFRVQQYNRLPRYAWTHGITPRKMDVVTVGDNGSGEFGKECLSVCSRGTRTSFTFRRILHGDCTCSYHEHCDSYHNREKKSCDYVTTVDPEIIDKRLDNTLAAKLETMHVHDVYEEIASHFSETRHKAWPNISDFVNSLPPASILLDIGCGNGKYFGFNNGIFEIGCDQSSSLALVTKGRGFQVFTCNCLHIPLKPGSADACICIAVIHHLSTKERRLQALIQIAEVLRDGGRALVYVWAKEQERQKVKSSYLRQMGKKSNEATSESDIPSQHCISGLDLSLPVHKNRTDFRHGDLLVPWKLNAKCDFGEKPEKELRTFFRYYHVFEEGELDSLCKEVPEVKVIKSYYDQGNWCVLLEKGTNE